ncbi:MAG: hypothetical protein LBL21_02280 [Rickettsiales bacterium]|jgi:hypothetical protein|nr:hypothetical protein [Rickettsiales bacterium]
MKKITKFVKKACDAVMRIGRWIGARRVLFVWSAASFAIAAFFGINSTIESFGADYIADMNVLALTLFLNVFLLFVKLFVPMLVLVIAAKMIFDYSGRQTGKPSETFRLSFLASAITGLAIGALYYLNAGHIIGSNASLYCDAGARCLFNWGMLALAAKAFLISGIGVMLTILGMRGIYTELTFMLSKRK